MKGLADQALGAIAAAVTARRLYGPDHAAATGARSRALGAVVAALAERDGLEYHFVDARVIGPEGVVACAPEAVDTLRRALGLRKANSLRLARGVCEPDLDKLLAALADAGPPSATIPHITLGHAEVEQVTNARAVDVPRPDRLIDQMRRSVPLDPSDPINPNNLEGIASGICMAVLGARGTMLDLASLKSHDEYTFVHTVNVSLLAAALAEVCGMSPSHVHDITMAALLHDLGKRAVPRAILAKRAPLREEERKVMQVHPVEGARLLLGHAGVPDVAAIVAYEHHMHLDDSGYPARARRRRPHLASQIVQQADVFDALRTHRPYRPALSLPRAIEILKEGAGTRYDRALVEAFVRYVASRARPSDQGAKAA